MISVSSTELAAFAGALLWPFVRVLALLATAPVLQGQVVPARVKIGLALLVALVLAPALPGTARHPLALPDGVLVLAGEVLVGVALGFAMRLVFAAVELAGDLVGLQMGLGFAGFVDPSASGQSPLIGSFLGLVASLVFLAMNGHLMVVAAAAQSFDAVPVGAGLRGVDAAALVQWSAGIFLLGVHLAAPVLAAMLIANLALGVLARTAPQLNLFAVGFPLTLVLGFAVLLFALPHLGAALERMIEAGFSTPVLRSAR